MNDERIELALDDWRLHDLALSLGAPEREFLAFDGTGAQRPAPVGVAGWAIAAAGGGRTENWQQTRRLHIEVQYLSVPQRTDGLTITSRHQEGVVHSSCAAVGTPVYAITQRFGASEGHEHSTGSASAGTSGAQRASAGTQRASAGTQRASAGTSGAQGIVEDLHRIRIARWVCATGENIAWHCNHVAAVDAGLPSALAPQSLLFSLVERYVRAVLEIHPRRLTMSQWGRDVYAGERLYLGVSSAADDDPPIVQGRIDRDTAFSVAIEPNGPIHPAASEYEVAMP